MLLELLEDKIQLIPQAVDWREAIRISAKPLLEAGSIEERYVSAMIQMCEKHNAYIVLADFFAMPHASPDSGVNKADVALTIIEEPVDFLGSPVHVLLTLASTASDSHILMLQEVGELMGDDERIRTLISLKTTEDVADFIQRTMKKNS